MFDNFLNIKNGDLDQIQLVIFSGVSGSGKSTYMKHIAQHHDYFKKQKQLWVNFGIPKNTNHKDILFLDDITRISDLFKIIPRLIRGQRIVMGSHLPIPALHFLNFFATQKLYRTDLCAEKLKRFLHAQQVSFSNNVLQNYIKMYKSNYTDMRLMMEHTQETQDFDKAYQHFQSYCHIQHFKNDVL